MIKIVKLRLIFPVIVFITLTLLFTLPLFKNQFYKSHDGEAHVARFGAYIKSFKDYQIPIRWAGDLNYRYGSPVLIFYYPLPGLISIPLSTVLSLENSFKIIIILSFLLSFYSFYLWIYEIFRDYSLSIIGGIIYGLSPYHFLNLYIRGDVAEMLALSLVPFVFLFIEKNKNKKNIYTVLLGSISYALVILSHNGISLLFSPIFLIYGIFRSSNIFEIIKNFSVIILGLMLSAFFWLPAILESKYTNINLFVGNMYLDHFPSVSKLIFSNWGFGPDVNKEGGLSPQIGIINLLLILGAVFVFLKYKSLKEKKFLLFWQFIFILFLFLTIKESDFLWRSIPLISKLQFPWRLVGVTSFAAAVLGVLFLRQLTYKFRFIAVVAVILYSVQFFKIEYINRRPDSFYYQYPGTTYYHGQASPIWTAGDFSNFPKKQFEIIEGGGQIIREEKKSNLHGLIINAKSEVRVLDNTTYFHGWQVKVNGEKVPIEFQDQNFRGLITFRVKPGLSSAKIRFAESPIRLISDTISVIGILILVLVYYFKSRVYAVFSKI